MRDPQAALYARVSSEQQAHSGSIASQVASLRERVAADGVRLEPGHAFLDEGYSGASLLRPALERLRDAVAAGTVDRVYVHSPDRLARRYAYQVLLVEEFRRAGGGGRVPEPADRRQRRGRPAPAGAGRDRRVRARQAPRARSPGAPPRRPLGLGERPLRGPLRLPLRRQGRRRRDGALRGGRGGGPDRAPDLRLGRPGAGGPARGLPGGGGGRLPPPDGSGALGPDHRLRHAQDPGLYRAGRLRALTLRAGPAPPAPDPGAASAVPEGQHPRPGSSGGVDRGTRARPGRAGAVRGGAGPAG